MAKMIQLQISLFQLQEPDSSIQATLEQGSWIGRNNTGCPNFDVLIKIIDLEAETNENSRSQEFSRE